MACHKEAIPDCGCGSSANELLTDVLGVYNDRGSITTLSPSKQYTGKYTLSCNPNFVSGKVANRDTVVLSGISYLPCYSASDILIEHPAVIELTAIRKR
jgi:hypothetical protein